MKEIIVHCKMREEISLEFFYIGKNNYIFKAIQNFNLNIENS